MAPCPLFQNSESGGRLPRASWLARLAVSVSSGLRERRTSVNKAQRKTSTSVLGLHIHTDRHTCCTRTNAIERRRGWKTTPDSTLRRLDCELQVVTGTGFSHLRSKEKQIPKSHTSPSWWNHVAKTQRELKAKTLRTAQEWAACPRVFALFCCVAQASLNSWAS